MSWFDATGFASLAKSALSTAQKTIDKALDIQEEARNSFNKHSSRKSDADTFFEAYGLSHDSSLPALSSEDKNESSHSETVPSEQQKKSSVWGDNWSSFFEVKGQPTTSDLEENLSSDTKKETLHFNQPITSANAVLSQPVKSGQVLSRLTGNMEDEILCEPLKEKELASSLENVNLLQSQKEKCIPVSSPKEPISSEDPIQLESVLKSSVEDSLNIEQIVTEQPCRDTTLSHNEHTSCSSIDENVKAFNVEAQSTVPICDTSKPIQKDIEPCITSKVPSIQTYPSSDSKLEPSMDQSEFFHLELPFSQSASSTNKLCVLNQNNPRIVMEMSSSESFTHVAPERLSDSENINCTLIIPDYKMTIEDNVANWDCCVDDSVLPDLDAATDNNSNLIVQTPESLNPKPIEPFVKVWSNVEKAVIEECQHSSNEERNSHHSDGSSNSSKDDDDTDTAEVKDCDFKSSASSGSFVKCSADRAQSPLSTTTSERSKQESEQTSGDENETTTSSDIEILSPPNGEASLKHAWPVRLRRSESPTSDSSKDSMMPVVNELDEVTYEEGNDSITTLYDDREGESHSIMHFSEENIKKQEELQTILVAREKKIVELSKENIELQENEQRLKNLMHKMRAEQAKESKDITSLTREFSHKLSMVEGKLKETTRERDLLQNNLQETKQKVIDRISSAQMDDVLKEKDKEIKELIEEGQKLSKKELTHTTIIKKLRVKEKEMEKTIKSQSEKLEDNSKEVERLRKSIEAKEEQEKKHIDAIRNLTNTVKKTEKEICSLKSDLEDSLEKELSVKRSLEGTYKDFTELQKCFAAKEKEVEDLRNCLDSKAEENLAERLASVTLEATRERDALLLQIQELRCTLSRTEGESNTREKMFKAEVASLQKRLQDAEERNEDLTKNMSTASRPLVRQMENLQSTFTAQTISWEKIEKNLMDRLSDAQNQIAMAAEKERNAHEKYVECSAKVTTLEAQNSALRQQKLQLSAQVETLTTKMALMEQNTSRESYTLEKVKKNLNSEINRLKQEKASLESTMTTCLEQIEQEKRKVHRLEEELKIKDARASILGYSPCPSPTGSARSSVSSLHNWSYEEGSETLPRMSVYESLRLGSGSSLLENLQSQLKQREGEINQLQSEIAKLEKVKESMTRELVVLSEQNETLEKKILPLQQTEEEFKELDKKYNTLLQMYGEKVEQTEELQLDLSEVTSLYKSQIEELLKKNETLF